MLLQGNQGQIGKQVGQNLVVGLGEFSDQLVSFIMSKYYEANYRGLKFMTGTPGAGVQLAAANLFSTAIATFQPILALYNPLTSLVNLVLQHAWCGLVGFPLATGTQTGGFYLVGNAGQSITNAQATLPPINCKTLKALGSQAIVIQNAVLAGAVGNPNMLRAIAALIALDTATANASVVAGGVPTEEIAGSIIIPPGGYVGIANGISNAVTGELVAAGFDWDEIPV